MAKKTPKPLLSVQVSVTTDEKIEVALDTELTRRDVIELLEQVVDHLEPEDTPEARAANAWGGPRRRRDE